MKGVHRCVRGGTLLRDKGMVERNSWCGAEQNRAIVDVVLEGQRRSLYVSGCRLDEGLDRIASALGQSRSRPLATAVVPRDHSGRIRRRVD
ncbi:hypothetical protein EVAR_62692_1 [Eumeta japonica]|uniref:Uncharacterized protein n=1 Tax=Eumeta variegata TaxID=151549 RepID=A0A4C1ZZ93_EUMVA|nr:hypothetical protein EVAR_62692_1 [Eumeta japonica]